MRIFALLVFVLYTLYAAPQGESQHTDENTTKSTATGDKSPKAQNFKIQKQEANPEHVLQCNAIFESRKDEITQSLRSLNEKMQNLEAYKNATQNLFDQRESKLKEQESALNAKIESMNASAQKIAKTQADEKKAIQDLIAKNEALLKEIKETSTSKVAKTFSGMKESKAAPIIAELDDAEAAGILASLSATEMAKILGKMDLKRAAELTKIIAKGPPFKSEKSQVAKTPGTDSTPDSQSSLDVENPQDSARFQENGGI